ncbi:MAG: Succinate dehydrogenase flavoprotein subunit, partial [uncultured Thermomicrobiales bacterium]
GLSPLRRGHRRRRRGRPDGGHPARRQGEHRRRLQALPAAVPHRRRPGRDQRRPGQHRGRPLAVAHVRHRQGRRLPGRPGRRRGARPGGGRRRARAGAHGAAVQPDAGRPDRPAPLRRPHPQLRGGSRPPRLLRGRPHRPHDHPDALPAGDQAQRQLPRRAPPDRPALHGRRDRLRLRHLRGQNRRDPHGPRQDRPRRDGGLRPGLEDHLERDGRHRRRDGGRLPPRRPPDGHGVLPVPSDRHLQAGGPPLGGGPGRGRHPPQRRRRSVRRPLRADARGPGATRHGLPLHLPGGEGGPRRQRRGLRLPRPHPPAAGADRREAAGHHRLCPDLPRGRAEDGADPDPADRPLRDGRHPDRHRGAGDPGRTGDADPRLLRRRRVGLCLRPRRQPARHQLAGRPGRLRAAGRQAHARLHRGQRPAAAADRSRVRRPRSARRHPLAAEGHPGHRDPGGDAGADDGQGLGRPRRGRDDGGEGADRRAAPGLRQLRHRRQGHDLQHRPPGGPRAGLHARLRRGDDRGGAGADGEPGRSLPRRLPEPGRRELAGPHPGLPRLRRAGDAEEAGDDHRVPAEGAEVL